MKKKKNLGALLQIEKAQFRGAFKKQMSLKRALGGGLLNYILPGEREESLVLLSLLYSTHFCYSTFLDCVHQDSTSGKESAGEVRDAFHFIQPPYDSAMHFIYSPS